MTSAVAPATAARAPAAPPSRARVAVRWLIDHRAQLLAGVAAAAITIGGLLHLLEADTAGHQVWRAAVALLIAFNATAINADERARATMLAYGVTVARVVRGSVAEAVIIDALGTAVGIAAGHGVLSWIVNENLPETMPDIGTLIAVAPLTYALATAAGTLVVAAASLLTLRKLRRTDISATLRVVE